MQSGNNDIRRARWLGDFCPRRVLWDCSYFGATVASRVVFGLAAALVCMALPVIAEDEEEHAPLPERFQSVLDRDPFQELALPDAPVPIAPDLQAQSGSFGRDIAMQGIMDDGEQVRVTFLDKRKNEFFRLRVGAAYDGMELVSVNYDDEEAVLRKGSETCLLSLKPENASSAAPAAAMPVPPREAENRRSNAPAFPMPDARSASYRGKTIEEFLKENPDAISQSPSPIRVPDPKHRAFGRGMSIEKFLKEHPEAAAQFPSPINPPDPAFKAAGKGETIERFLRENPGSVRQIPIPQPVQAPSPEEFGENVRPPG